MTNPPEPNAHFDMEDLVRVKGDDEVWTVKGYHQGVNKYQVQLRADAATLKWVAASDLELAQHAKRNDDDGPRFVPTRGIMD